MFLLDGMGRYQYRLEEMERLVEARINRERPAIVEGVVALRVLKEMNREPAFHIHVTCRDVEAPNLQDWAQYVKRFTPLISADLVLDLPAT